MRSGIIPLFTVALTLGCTPGEDAARGQNPVSTAIVTAEVDNSVSIEFIKKYLAVENKFGEQEDRAVAFWNEAQQSGNRNRMARAAKGIAEGDRKCVAELNRLVAEYSGRAHARILASIKVLIGGLEYSETAWNEVFTVASDRSASDEEVHRAHKKSRKYLDDGPERFAYRIMGATTGSVMRLLAFSGSDMGKGPLEAEQRAAGTAVRDPQSLADIESFIDCMAGLDGAKQEKFNNMWLSGQGLLTSNDLADVRRSADQCRRALDYKAKILETIENANWERDGVHPFVINLVRNAREFAKLRQDAAGELLEARYRFADNPTDQNLAAHNAILQRLGELDIAANNLDDTLAVLRYLFREGLVLAPLERIQQGVDELNAFQNH